MADGCRSRVDGALAVRGNPPGVTGGQPLRGADYSDRFTLATSVGAGAELWARAMFGHVPDRRLRLVLATICRFRLRRHVRSDLIAGMTVLDRSAGQVQLGLFGPLLIGRLTVTTSPGEATLVT